jgi:peptidoglycan-associated lipoprotein
MNEASYEFCGQKFDKVIWLFGESSGLNPLGENMKSARHLVRPLTSVVMIAALAFTLGCAKKAVKDANGADQANGNEAPSIEDKNISTDPMGSDSGKINGLSTVFFDYDKATLTSDARQKLSQNAAWIKNNPSYTVQIEGHTDSRGSVEYNLSLGERRAKSVKSYLEGLGVDSKRMTIISYGEEKPLVPGDSEAAWAKNRRANFVPLQ